MPRLENKLSTLIIILMGREVMAEFAIVIAKMSAQCSYLSRGELALLAMFMFALGAVFAWAIRRGN